MRTIKVKLFSFDELNEEAKKVAIEKRRNIKYECGWILDNFHDNAIDKINESGFENPQLQYSLSHCQGDGLSFSATTYDREKLKVLFRTYLGENKEKTLDTILEYCSFKLTGNIGHYCYTSSSQLTFEFDDYKASHVQIHTLVSNIEKDLQGIYTNLCKELEKEGYETLDYEYSDECIIEDLQENECEFTEDGNKY